MAFFLVICWESPACRARTRKRISRSAGVRFQTSGGWPLNWPWGLYDSLILFDFYYPRLEEPMATQHNWIILNTIRNIYVLPKNSKALCDHKHSLSAPFARVLRPRAQTVDVIRSTSAPTQPWGTLITTFLPTSHGNQSKMTPLLSYCPIVKETISQGIGYPSSFGRHGYPLTTWPSSFDPPLTVEVWASPSDTWQNSPKVIWSPSHHGATFMNILMACW